MGGKQRTTLFHTKESAVKEEAKQAAASAPKEKAKKQAKEKSK